jgi:uncharacterized ion transporter superfamily protein YfcC
VSTLERIRVPHVFVLLTVLVFVVSLATYVVPSGEFQRETRVIEGSERTLVVPGTYTRMPKAFSVQGVLVGGDAPEGTAAPVSVRGFLTAIPRGLVESADIIFMIFIIGGAFGILQQSGTIAAAIGKLLATFGRSPTGLTIAIMVALAVGGSTLGMGEEFIPLVPMFLLVAGRLGYDRLYGVALVALASEVGFAAATTNPFTVNIAQGIAELPLNSGIGLRLAFFALAMTLAIVHVLRYGARIRRDPSASLVPADDAAAPAVVSPTGGLPDAGDFDRRHRLALAAAVVIFAVLLYGVQRFGWWMDELSGGFFLMGVLGAAICGMRVDEAARAFVRGMENMVVAALVVGFARAISVVMTDGHILDTLIGTAAAALATVPRYVSVEGMLLFQTTLNFFIPSGSGQAAVTMPLMTPLADVLGLTRQTAVLAFQFGDGLSNMVIPTSGVLMAMLALARVPYTAWLRFAGPLFLQLIGLAAVFLAIAVWIGY